MTYRVPGYAFLYVTIVEVILEELDSGAPVRLIELVGDIPAQRAKLPTLLYDGMEEGDSVQHRPPLYHVTYIQKILCHTCNQSVFVFHCTLCIIQNGHKYYGNTGYVLVILAWTRQNKIKVFWILFPWHLAGLDKACKWNVHLCCILFNMIK